MLTPQAVQRMKSLDKRLKISIKTYSYDVVAICAKTGAPCVTALSGITNNRTLNHRTHAGPHRVSL
jgi:hypothetical protein